MLTNRFDEVHELTLAGVCVRRQIAAVEKVWIKVDALDVVGQVGFAHRTGVNTKNHPSHGVEPGLPQIARSRSNGRVAGADRKEAAAVDFQYAVRID